jgi:hypothetical protein
MVRSDLELFKVGFEFMITGLLLRPSGRVYLRALTLRPHDSIVAIDLPAAANNEQSMMRILHTPTLRRVLPFLPYM